MEFTLAGRTFDLNPEDVLKKVRDVSPEIVRTHAVRVKGKLYPVKQALALVTGLSKADFNSHQARHVLKRMGLEVIALVVLKNN